MALDFPTSPLPGTIFNGGNGSWLWDGTKWKSAIPAMPQGAADYDQLVWVGGEWTVQRARYIVSCFVPGPLSASQTMLMHRLTKAITIPANGGLYLGHQSEAAAGTPPTAGAVVMVSWAAAGTPTVFGNVISVTFTAGQPFAVFASTGPVNFAQGDILRIQGPVSADATLTDVYLTIVGYET